MSYLLDVNVLIVLAWPAHQHHTPATMWFEQQASSGWATCAITESSFVRITSQPSFTASAGYDPVTVDQAGKMLRANIAHKNHQFLDLNFGFDKVLSTCTGGLQGHRQITDAYLLTLAIQNKRQLVTFDSGIGSLLATTDERHKHLLVLS